MEKFLRDWRQDALNKAQYESAVFIGDKLLALTNDDKDAFWLAQVHFASGNYTRAQALLSKQDLIARNPSCRYLAGHCLIKQSRYEEALSVLGERNPTHLVHNAAKRKALQGKSARNNASTSANNRTAGAAVGAAGGGKAGSSWLAYSHENRRNEGADQQQQEQDEEAANRRYEASMCYLRGICYAKQNAFDRAKECYKDAVRIDLQCFEAFDQLMRNSLLSPDEEHEFLESLDFSSLRAPVTAPRALTAPRNAQGGEEAEEVGQLADEPADYVHMLYYTRLSKYQDPAAFHTAVESLSTHYGLASNPDLLLARADLLYTQCRFRDALALTSAVLDEDKYNFALYPLHLACLYELKMHNALFLVAHDLADQHPEEPCTWLAVGTYYFATDKVAEARRYFSKASMMDAHFAPAWIGFAHTFAAEGEHDQAVSAYSTATRLFMGTHLPQVFLGMQHSAMNNMTVAEEFLRTAYGLCRADPLLLNEMGVVLYHQDRLPEAASMFRRALEVAAELDADAAAWLAPRTNLGHAFRRLGRARQALDQFDEVLRLGGKDAQLFCARGLLCLDLGQPDEAVRALHEALAIHPQDPIATELLNKALEETAGAELALLAAFPAPEEEDQFDRQLQRRMMQARARGRGRGPAAAGDEGTLSKGKGKAVNRSTYRRLGPQQQLQQRRHTDDEYDEDDDDEDRNREEGEESMMDMAEDE